jgi:hypothetical protein
MTDETKALPHTTLFNGPPKVFGLGGWFESGKDAFADHLLNKFHFYFVKFQMSEPMQEHMLLLNPWVVIKEDMTFEDAPKGYTLEAGIYPYRALVGIIGYVNAKKIPYVRQFLQTYGTEVVRKSFGENAWVDIISKRTIEEVQGWGRNVVITGIRYPNELDMIHALGGETIWITRPGKENNSQHSSERSLTAADFDREIMNDGSLEDLYHKAELVITELGGKL